MDMESRMGTPEKIMAQFPNKSKLSAQLSKSNSDNLLHTSFALAKENSLRAKQNTLDFQEDFSEQKRRNGSDGVLVGTSRRHFVVYDRKRP